MPPLALHTTCSVGRQMQFRPWDSSGDWQTSENPARSKRMFKLCVLWNVAKQYEERAEVRAVAGGTVGPCQRRTFASSLDYATDESYPRAVLPRTTDSDDPYHDFEPQR